MDAPLSSPFFALVFSSVLGYNIDIAIKGVLFMKNKHWYLLWGALYIICAGLGFIPEPAGFLKWLLILTALAFFVPGWMLLYLAHSRREPGIARVVRTVSLLSLCFTLIFLVLNLLSGNASDAAGEMLYSFLVIFSAPMICLQYWIVSLFLWACLLMTSISILIRAKKR